MSKRDMQILREFIRSASNQSCGFLFESDDSDTPGLSYAKSFYFNGDGTDTDNMKELKAIMDWRENGFLSLWIDDFTDLIASATAWDEKRGFPDNLTSLLACYGIMNGDYDNFSYLLGTIPSGAARISAAVQKKSMIHEGLSSILDIFGARLAWFASGGPVEKEIAKDAVAITSKMFGSETIKKALADETFEISSMITPLVKRGTSGVLEKNATTTARYPDALKSSLVALTSIPKEVNISDDLSSALRSKNLKATGGALVEIINDNSVDQGIRDEAERLSDDLNKKINALVDDEDALKEVLTSVIKNAASKQETTITSKAIKAIKTPTGIISSLGAGAIGAIDTLSNPQSPSVAVITDQNMDTLKRSALSLADDIEEHSFSDENEAIVSKLRIIGS